MFQSLKPSWAVIAAMLLVPAWHRAEAGQTDLEARVQTLEERIKKLEDALAKERGQRAEPGNDWWQRRGLGQDLQQLMERMQREAYRDFGGQQWQWQWPPAAAPANKPRLGVELAPPTDELRERFKNDTQEGAFVMSIVPGSAAEKAGLNVGDCITSFNGKEVNSPPDLIDAVKAAPPGKSDLIVLRRGESLKLKVELGEQGAVRPGEQLDEAEDAPPRARPGPHAVKPGEQEAEEHGPAPAPRGGWLRRGDAQGRAKTKTRAEVKASALEVSDELAKELELTAEQKKKMGEVLAKHSAALTEGAALKADKGAHRGGLTFSMDGDVSRLVEKHVAEAEKELDGTLSADQLKKWAKYRKEHSSLSVSHSVTFEGGAGAEAENENDNEKMNF
ncbi:MAG: PDZ domain-containing protein [Planctomycetota bacterium]